MTEASRERAQTVLIVDDDPRMRAYIRDLLGTESDISILGEAKDGEEAIRLVQQLRPGVVLMDLAMPGVDGFETTRRMKADPLTKNTVVCAVTALALPADQQLARDAGCDAVFIKPVDVTLLVAEIERLAQRIGRSCAS